MPSPRKRTEAPQAYCVNGHDYWQGPVGARCHHCGGKGYLLAWCPGSDQLYQQDTARVTYADQETAECGECGKRILTLNGRLHLHIPPEEK